MRFHFAAVPVHGSAEVERELNAFLGSHRVLGVERHLVADGAQSVWAICVSYADATSHHAASHDLSNPSRGGPGRKERVDYKEILGAVEFATFAKLREWRKVPAERDGVPPYAVLTNEQLAEIVRRPNWVNRGGAWNRNARNVRAANRNANTRGNRNSNLGFRLAGAQTQARAACNGSAPDQTAVATGGVCRRRTPTGPRRASSGSGCAVERSPGLRLSGSRTRWP